MYVSSAIIAGLIVLVVLLRWYWLQRLPTKANNQSQLNKYDYLVMLMGTIAYAGFSFYHIGSFTQDPVWYGDKSGKEINLILAKPSKVAQLTLDTCFDPSNITKLYAQTVDKKTVDFAVSKTESSVEPKCSILSLTNQESNVLLERIKLRVVSPDMIIYKLKVFDDKHQQISNYAYYYDADKNLDNPEKIFVGKESANLPFATQYGRMIFDERYYALDSYHYLVHGTQINSAHPQLAILLNAIGIKVFGMNPFGWRFIPNLFAILLLPLVYLFTRRLFGQPIIALLAMLFVGVDFMHFTLGRMALLESTVTFFIVASYYWLWRYLQLRTQDTQRGFIALFYCGLMVGIALACKWSGGFIVPFLIGLVLLNEYRLTRLKYYWLSLLCIIVLPSLIYLVSYVPYIWLNKLAFWQSFTQLQYAAWLTHSKLTLKSVDVLELSASSWWSWPLALDNLLLNSAINVFTVQSFSLVLMGNPILWWASIPTFVLLAVLVIKERNRAIGYLWLIIVLQYLPYVVAKRSMYLYYYYSISIFVFIGVAYLVYRLAMCYKTSRFYFLLAVGYVILAVGACIAYYPVYAGKPTDFAYVYRDLSLVPSWNLVVKPNIFGK